MKTFLGVLGVLLIIGTIFGGNLQQITNWSTPELVGFNLWSLIAIFGGGYLFYWGIIKKKK